MKINEKKATFLDRKKKKKKRNQEKCQRIAYIQFLGSDVLFSKDHFSQISFVWFKTPTGQDFCYMLYKIQSAPWIK